jgi:hypothetical protein
MMEDNYKFFGLIVYFKQPQKKRKYQGNVLPLGENSL